MNNRIIRILSHPRAGFLLYKETRIFLGNLFWEWAIHNDIMVSKDLTPLILYLFRKNNYK